MADSSRSMRRTPRDTAHQSSSRGSPRSHWHEPVLLGQHPVQRRTARPFFRRRFQRTLHHPRRKDRARNIVCPGMPRIYGSAPPLESEEDRNLIADVPQDASEASCCILSVKPLCLALREKRMPNRVEKVEELRQRMKLLGRVQRRFVREQTTDDWPPGTVEMTVRGPQGSFLRWRRAECRSSRSCMSLVSR